MPGEPTDEPTDELWPVMSGLHRVLLRLAGRMPDDWMVAARTMLGDYEVGYLPDAISGAVATAGVSLPAEDIALLRRLHSQFAGPRPPAGVDRIPVAPYLPPVAYRFAASRDGEAAQTDTHDDSAETVAGTEPAVVALRRAWRTDPAGSAPPVRVYLVEVDPGAEAWVIGQDIAGLLDWSPERPAPQIEVYWTGEELPPYHQAALAGSMVVWQRPGAAGPAATADEPGRDLVERFADAARQRRFDDLRRLVDWPLTGAPRVALRLAELDPADREFDASGLIPGLFTAGDDPDRVQRVLWQVVDLIGEHPAIRRADPAERREILEQLRVPDVPAQGLSAGLLAQLAELRLRSAELSEVYLVGDGSLTMPLAWAPGSDRLVLYYE